MRTLALFAGLPGCGKTTICRHISGVAGVHRVDVDHYKKLRTDPSKVTEEVDPPALRLLYCQDALNVAFALFDAGASTVVMDEVYPYQSVRVQLEQLCVDRGIRVLWVEVRSSDGVAERRLASRTGHALLPLDKAVGIHQKCADAFEAFPASSPNHIVVDNDEKSDIELLATGVLDRILDR